MRRPTPTHHAQRGTIRSPVSSTGAPLSLDPTVVAIGPSATRTAGLASLPDTPVGSIVGGSPSPPGAPTRCRRRSDPPRGPIPVSASEDPVYRCSEGAGPVSASGDVAPQG